jgi:tetratricopeptide (TPR) repeat protein
MDRLGPEETQSLAEIQRVRDDLEQCVQARPDAQALCCLAHLDLQCYRLRVYERFCRQVPAETDRNALWRATRPTVLHGRIQQYAAAGDVRSLERIRSEPAVADHLLPALRRLVLARRACPLLPQVHLLIAELGVLASEPAENQIHLTRAKCVGPAQASLALESGILEFQAGRTAEAIDSWRRCLALDADQLPEIARRVRAMGKVAEVLPNVLPDSPETLVRVARDDRMIGSDASLRAKLLDQAAAAIDRSGYSEAERCYWRGAIGSLREDPAAIDEYLRAVKLDPQNLIWRYELAGLLQGRGRWTEAHEQARFCAMMEPTNAKYRSLLKQVGRARIAAGDDVR